MNIREIPLYRQIEERYAAQAKESQATQELRGRERYAYQIPSESTVELALQFLDTARDQKLDHAISPKLINLYGELAGYMQEIVAHRDFDSLVVLLSLANLERNPDVRLSLMANETVVNAVGSTIYHHQTDETSLKDLRPHADSRITTLQSLYTIDGGLQKQVMESDTLLFERLSQWPEQLHTYQHEDQTPED